MESTEGVPSHPHLKCGPEWGVEFAQSHPAREWESQSGSLGSIATVSRMCQERIRGSVKTA